MKKQIYKWIFENLMGWKIEGNFDEEIKKCILIVMPHTSWHDFYIAIICRGALGVDINWVGKKELFRFPFGYFFKYFGGTPLDRAGGLNKVESIVNIFNSKEIFRLGISPEGTRKKVEQLKTGFYYIALHANVPVIPVSLNFEKKIVEFGKPFYTTGNLDSDLLSLNKHFVNAKGKIPENDYKFP
ncbi:1-acyl-sn-glycerol-3-phosphate acyltransferase [Flavobacterium gilvum]|uniref:Acyltransferase n=1 Tax=Flavobacterium gilvum TaxID=1492737 RepID=A0AAC9I4F9_9FLAO|nr:1-acyl-sn-glycerol-3-phosphate acyltransferase [Flavobacterium gilvum]AOW10216.1 acyltransferase [Flavobacterium gilvum]KFC58644.1 acyltransferase [Flavobacterium gilvum]